MTLVVEDGSIVPGANCYVTVAEIRAYAESRGIFDLPADDAGVEALAHNAMDWFESNQFAGVRTDVVTPQELSFPRTGIVIDGYAVPGDMIPPLVKACVMQAAVDANSVTLQPTFAGSEGGGLRRKKLEGLEKEFFGPQYGYSRDPYLGKVSSMILPLLGNGFGSGRLPVYRS